MPYGFNLASFFSPGSRFAAPPSLTLADLFTPAPRPAYAPLPNLPSSYEETNPQAPADLRREALLRFAAALAAPGGRTGEALARGASDLSQWKRDRLDEARMRGEHDAQIKGRQAEIEAEKARLDAADTAEKRKAQGRLEAVQAIGAMEPDLAPQIEAAALAGDDVQIREITKEAYRRKTARDRGEDPSDPFADERAREKIKSEETLRRERELKKEGLDRYFEQPLSMIEARSAAAARGQKSIWGERGAGGGGAGAPVLRTSNGKVYEVARDANGQETMHLIPGQSEAEGRWQYVGPDRLRGTPGFWTNPSGAVRPEAEPPRPVATVLGEIEQGIGRKLSAAERSDAGKRYAGGEDPSTILQSLKAPKRLVSPASAPTQGKVPAPATPKKTAPPAQVKKAQASWIKRKVEPQVAPEVLSARRQQALASWQKLPPETRKAWGSFDAYFAKALAAAGE